MKQIQLKDFLNYKFLSNVQCSKDGKVAFVVAQCNEEDNSYDSYIYLYHNQNLCKLTAMGKERSFFWEDEEHILFPAVRSESEKKRQKEKEMFSSYYRINIHGGEAEKAFEVPFSVEQMQYIDDELYLVTGRIDANYPDYYCMTEEERKNVAKDYTQNEDYEVFDEAPFWANGGGFINKKRTALFLYNVKTKECIRITEPHFNVTSTVVGKNKIYFCGELYSTKPAYREDVYAYDIANKSLTCIYNKKEVMIHSLQQVGEKLVLFASEGRRFGINENPYMYELDSRTGELQVLQAWEDNTWSSVGSDCRYGAGNSIKVVNDEVYFITTIRNSSFLYKMDSNGEVTKVVTQNGSIDCFDINEVDGSIYLVGMYDMKLQELYHVEQQAVKPIEKTTQITTFNEDILKDKYVAKPEKLTIESEGVAIDGWVLKPYNYNEANSYPAILDIHGGPKTVYGEVFYHEMQLWANEGYFVFFCNPTGSDGRGNEFADIRGKYGTIDYKNIMDFTDAVLDSYPQIDVKRVAVTGGSYGGFMTNWIIGHTDRFSCAATQRSISNWISFYGVSDIGMDFGTDQTGGNVFDNMEKMWWHSPLAYAKNIKTPTLFIHSNEDYRCPLEQGLQLYTALVDRGVPTRMCYFREENHELSRSGKPKRRVRRLTEITEWINAYCK